MAEDEREPRQAADELEVTDLRTRHVGGGGNGHWGGGERLPGPSARTWRRLALGLSLVLLTASWPGGSWQATISAGA